MTSPPVSPPPGTGTVPRPGMPGTVQAASILLAIGGALILLNALLGVSTSGMLSSLPRWLNLLYGLLYLLLAWKVRHGRQWARTTVLVLCWIGIALAAIRLVLYGIGIALTSIRLVAAGPGAVISTLVWPVIYLVLLNTESAKAWFRSPGDPAS